MPDPSETTLKAVAHAISSVLLLEGGCQNDLDLVVNQAEIS